jgi:hypothetical protein
MDTNPFELSEDDSAAIAAMDGSEELETEVTETPAEEEPAEGAESEEQQQPEQKKTKTVPHQALHQERMERKKAEERARSLEAQFAQLNERLRQAAEAQREPPPDPDQDPIAALRYEREQREALQRAIEEQRQQQHQAYQQQQFENEVISYASSQVQEFRAENPSYDEALQYLEKVRSDELSLFGMTPQQIKQQIHGEAMNLAANCAQRGANVAETIYRMAEVRGFRPKPDTSKAEEKIKTVSTAQERSKSLSSAGGKSGGAEMTVETLLKMEPDEFDSWCRKNPAKAKALMGG